MLILSSNRSTAFGKKIETEKGRTAGVIHTWSGTELVAAAHSISARLQNN